MNDYFAGRYELLEPFASGGMGTVWRVRDAHDNTIKAAKILRQSDAASLLRFMREQSVRIDHHHVVTPTSWAGMDDQVLFTMPMVRGGSVADLLREHGALPVRWAVELTDQLLQALEAVHAAGIVHRDVKPANLLLEPTGGGQPHLRLTDFGIAAPVDEPRMTRASMAIGSPGYMAPEQWHGADPDPRADLYAVAAVAVEMVTGNRPPADPTALAVPTQEAGTPAAAFLELLRPALAADPAARPESATRIREALAASGLLQLPPETGEQLVISDRFGQSPGAPTLHLHNGTRAETALGPTLLGSSDGDLTQRRSPAPGYSLIALGLVALVAALLLLVL